jgi:hypothetical protein
MVLHFAGKVNSEPVAQAEIGEPERKDRPLSQLRESFGFEGFDDEFICL